MNLLNEYEHTLIDAELHEIETARAELSFYNEDGEGQVHVKLSRRSWDILMAAVGYIKENKEMDGDWDD